MRFATALVPKPDKRRGAPTTARPVTKTIINGSSDTTSALRLQRLHVVGLHGCTATLVAALAWGDLQHG